MTEPFIDSRISFDAIYLCECQKAIKNVKTKINFQREKMQLKMISFHCAIAVVSHTQFDIDEYCCRQWHNHTTYQFHLRIKKYHILTFLVNN